MTLLLTDTFYLTRAGTYSNPSDENALLPIVYGDLTDRTAGNWVLPCIDKTNFVYAYADNEVLAAANGNSVTIYVDGVEAEASAYTFDESNNYESLGNIATVTFTADQGNATISARGKGKVLTGTTLMVNIIDIVYDFLTVHCGLAAGICDGTAMALARSTFEMQSYVAAGVIAQDTKIWETIAQMMASFLGSAYIAGDGDLVLDIDLHAINNKPYAGIVRRFDASMTECVQRLENVINRAPGEYRFNYVGNGFSGYTDRAGYSDPSSAAMFGERSNAYQFYWCRHSPSIERMQEIIVRLFSFPVYEVTLELPTLKYMHIDVGDIFVWSASDLYEWDVNNAAAMDNHYWRCLSVAHDFQRGKMTIKAMSTPHYMTEDGEIADGSVTADGSHTAAGTRISTVY